MNSIGEPESLLAELERPLLSPATTQVELRVFLEARTPPLPAPATAREWQRAAGSLRRRFLAEIVYRGVPRAWIEGEPRVEWGETRPGESYRIRKLRYQALPGLAVPALLYEPGGEGPAPAVLNVNGHVGAPGKAREDEQLRCINLAKRGMLALHPQWLNCGELSHPEYTHNRLAYLDLCGRSGVAVFYLAMRRALDVLLEHPRADPKRVAMTGLSGGGWQTIWLSALDDRIRVSAPNAGYIGQRERLYHRGDVGDLEQNPVDFLLVGDYPHLTALLAPRPTLLIFNEEDDCCFRTERAVPSVFEPVLPFYRLHHRAASFHCHSNVDPGTHNYDRENREQLYRFLDEVWRPGGPPSAAEMPCSDEVLSFEQLRAGVPGPAAGGRGRVDERTSGRVDEPGQRGFGGLAEELLPALPRLRWPEGNDRAAAEQWQGRARRQLAGLLRFRAVGPATPVAGEPAAAGPPDSMLIRRILRVEGAPPIAPALSLACRSAPLPPAAPVAATGWTLPVVELSPPEPVSTAVVIAQGRGEAVESVRTLLARKMRVVVADLLLCGECEPAARGAPGAPTRAQQAMLIGAAGERLLAIQASQLQALLTWAAEEFGSKRLTLAGVGRNAAVIAAVTAALEPEGVEQLLLVGLPASLKLLIEERVEYDDAPELFCFGLLERFDVRELLGMSAARRMTLESVWGGSERIQEELGGLAAFRRRLGEGSETMVRCEQRAPTPNPLPTGEGALRVVEPGPGIR